MGQVYYKYIILALVSCLTLGMYTQGWASDATTTTELAIFPMAMGLFGGLALFLYGMEMMANGLKAAAGERLQLILARLTTNRFMGAITGAFVTAVIQSSSVTTVLVVGFVATHLMSLSQAIGVIMGANIGTTITAQIVAFKVTHYALLMVAVGFLLQFFKRHGNLAHYGNIVMGLGLVFFGMSVMSDAMYPLRAYQPFLDLMQNMANPLYGIAVAAAFTALVQSSSATTGIIIVMAGQGFITLPAGIALALGANIGTCFTALLASIGKPRIAIRAAVVHVLFNVFGVLLWLGFIEHLANVSVSMSPVVTDLSGIERLAAEVPRQIANANTLFNVINTLVFIGFATYFAKMAYWLVPEKIQVTKQPIKPKYIDPLLLDTPALAINASLHETRRLAKRIQRMVITSVPRVLNGDTNDLKKLAKMDKKVDHLYAELVNYLRLLSKTPLTDKQSEHVLQLLEVCNALESIGDVVEKNLVHLGQQRLQQNVVFSEQTRQVLAELHTEVVKALELAMDALNHKDVTKAEQVLAVKEKLSDMRDNIGIHETQRLLSKDKDRIASYTVETDIVENIYWIYNITRRIAKAVVQYQDHKIHNTVEN